MRSKVESTSVLTIPNRRDDHGEREQHPEDREDHADPGRLAVDEVVLVLDLGVREGRERLRDRVCGPSDEREPVAALLERRVERGVRDRDRAEAEHVEHGGLLDPAHGQRQRLAAHRGDGERAADVQSVLLGEAVVDERAVAPRSSCRRP